MEELDTGRILKSTCCQQMPFEVITAASSADCVRDRVNAVSDSSIHSTL